VGRLLIIAAAAALLLLTACQEPISQAQFPQKAGKQARPSSGKKLDLNSATAQQLSELKDGRKRLLTNRQVESITEFRTLHRFKRVADLLAVPSIGEKTFLKIRNHFVVGD